MINADRTRKNGSDGIEGFGYFFGSSIPNKDVAVRKCIEHGRTNGRGIGCWKEGRICVVMIHHGHEHCLHPKTLRLAL